MSHEAFPTDRPAVVTCGLPYANGDLHVGHMRTYVSGDVMFFGTDGRPGGDTKWPRSVAQQDKRLLAALKVSRANQAAYFAANFERFLTQSLTG